MEKSKEVMVKRETFIAKVRPFYEITDLVKIIVGIRRAGKSVLLAQIADELRQSGIDKNRIIFINFEFFFVFKHLFNPFFVQTKNFS